MDRAILHCDMNNFYASVECIIDPNLKDKYVAVTGSQEERHGIVLAKNTMAKNMGVQTGEAIWQAKKKCPELVIIDHPHFEKYEEYSYKARKIYKEYTDLIEPMGLDENWLDVTASLKLFGKPYDIAFKIKERIKKELGLTISVGVSFNKVFAKLGSDYKKPDAITEITRENFKDLLWPLPAADMLGVGRSSRKVLEKYFIRTIGDIANETPERMEHLLGKNGLELYKYANGLDEDPVKYVDEADLVKSIGHGLTTVKDLTTDEDVWKLMLELTQEIALKLRAKDLRAGGVAVAIRTSDLNRMQFQKSFKLSEQSALNIAKKAFELFKSKYTWEKPIRSVTVTAINLMSLGTPEQLTLFDELDKKEKIEKAEKAMEGLNLRYGDEIVFNATLYEDSNLPENRRKMKYEK